MSKNEYFLSIIIPTYNRCEELEETLIALNNQINVNKFEVVIVDDGSTDQTKLIVLKFKEIAKFELLYIYQINSGPSVARNVGINKSNGNLVMFIGDDTRPADMNFLNKHITFLKKYNFEIASLGLTCWDKRYNSDEFMNFLAPYGIQFNYTGLKQGDLCHWGMLWTSNIVLLKKWFDDNLFDTNFKYAALEDVELGYRFRKKGLKIRFNSSAIMFHNHHYELKGFKKRQFLVGRSLFYFLEKWPELVGEFRPKRIFIKKTILFFKVIFPFLLKIKLFNKYYLTSLLTLKAYEGYLYEKSNS